MLWKQRNDCEISVRFISIIFESLSHLDPMTKTLYEETPSCPPDSYGFHLPERGYRSEQDKELIMDAVPGLAVSCFSTLLTYPYSMFQYNKISLCNDQLTEEIKVYSLWNDIVDLLKNQSKKLPSMKIRIFK